MSTPLFPPLPGVSGFDQLGVISCAKQNSYAAASYDRVALRCGNNTLYIELHISVAGPAASACVLFDPYWWAGFWQRRGWHGRGRRYFPFHLGIAVCCVYLSWILLLLHLFVKFLGLTTLGSSPVPSKVVLCAGGRGRRAAPAARGADDGRQGTDAGRAPCCIRGLRRTVWLRTSCSPGGSFLLFALVLCHLGPYTQHLVHKPISWDAPKACLERSLARHYNLTRAEAG